MHFELRSQPSSPILAASLGRRSQAIKSHLHAYMQGGVIAASFITKPPKLALDIRPDAGIQQALGLPGANIATNPGSAC
jgi:hypothetical protein